MGELTELGGTQLGGTQLDRLDQLDQVDRYLLISSDCHGGPRPQDARAYLDP